MEPPYEAIFEPNSYRFGPGEKANNARHAIVNSLEQLPKRAFDAGTEECFDDIDHSKQLLKVNTFPTLKEQWRA